MTNNEANAAHRILMKYGILHTIDWHGLPLYSKDFAVCIGMLRFDDFEDVRKYIKNASSNHKDAAIDLGSWKIGIDTAKKNSDSSVHSVYRTKND